jgi:alcohol dehydrogenase (cytochrome c)
MLAVTALRAQVPPERLLNAPAESQNWLTYWGDYSGVRHRALEQINTANVKDLRLAWIFQTGVAGRFETVPLVVDGVMYLSGGEGLAFAADARSGRQLWRYKYSVPEGVKLCCGTVNRGLAIAGERVFMATPDAHLVALDAKTGRLLWDIEFASWKQGYGATLAPLVIKDKVLVGVSGGEFGIRGFIDAYKVDTGARAWRFWTVPAAGEPGGDTWLADSWKRGGGPTWMTGTYDPQLNLTYWGVGNPGPDLYGGDRIGDNLFTNSVVALDADTGKLKWHYQFTPHDTHDWDAAETPVLLDLEYKGKMRKLLAQANRNAFFYLLDRETGEFLFAKAFGRQSWLKEFDAKGRPVYLPNIEPTPDGIRLCPGLAGGANWMAPSYNPQTKLFYFVYREQCDVYYAAPPEFIEGKAYWGSVSRGWSDEAEWGVLKALDPLTGESKWTFNFHRAGWAGTLSTSGGLIFAGDADGYLAAFDARSGKVLWKVNTGAELASSPMTYMAGGKQYVVMPSGAALVAFALP